GSFHSLVKRDERSQFDATEILDVGEIQQQVAFPQVIHVPFKFLGEDILDVSNFITCESDDLDVAALLHLGRQVIIIGQIHLQKKQGLQTTFLITSLPFERRGSRSEEHTS